MQRRSVTTTRASRMPFSSSSSSCYHHTHTAALLDRVRSASSSCAAFSLLSSSLSSSLSLTPPLRYTTFRRASSASTSSWGEDLDDVPPPPLPTSADSSSSSPDGGGQVRRAFYEDDEDVSEVVASASSHQQQHQRRTGTFTVQEMEENLKRQLGPQAQLNVREQRQRRAFVRRTPQQQQQQEQEEEEQRRQARRLDEDDNNDDVSSAEIQKQQQQQQQQQQQESQAQVSSSSSLYRSSVTFRQNGFNITLWTAESTESPEHAMRLAYNGAVATGVRFFNPTLKPKEADVFDRVRYLALGMGKMVRFSIGGGGENLSLGQQQQHQEEGEGGEEDQDNDDVSDKPMFVCTAYIKDDWVITAGRSGDDVLLQTAARSAQEAFSNAIREVRDKLTRETESGEHALEDVRELQLALDNRATASASPSSTGCGGDAVFSSSGIGDSLVDLLSEQEDAASVSHQALNNRKTLYPELKRSYIFRKSRRAPGANRFAPGGGGGGGAMEKGKEIPNYTAKITVTDSFGNSYVVKSGEVNRSALLAYRSCVNQIYKRESFLIQNPTKAFFTTVQWETEHLTWYSGLARSLDWDFHYRATARSQFHASPGAGGQRVHSSSTVSIGDSRTTYYHATLHIGPVDLASADGAAGRYRVMLNCYCNALERLLSNCPRNFTQNLPIPTLEVLYSAYAEVDRFNPVDALKSAVKGLNPQTVLGAVIHLHLGNYFHMGIERRQSQRYRETGVIGDGGSEQQQNQQQGEQQQKQFVAGNAEDFAVVTVPLPGLDGNILIGEASSIKPGPRGHPVVLGRQHASKFAASYALRDNFQTIYNQVKDRVDYRYGTDRENERKRQQLRAIPRDKQVTRFSTLLSMMKEFGEQDFGWVDIDVDCIVRNSGLWVATCFAREEKDGLTRDLRTSRPASTKAECRRNVLIETSFKLWPEETRMYFQKNHSMHEFPGVDVAAIMENMVANSAGGKNASSTNYSSSSVVSQSASSAMSLSSAVGSSSSSGTGTRMYDPVGGGSLMDQLLSILEERTAPKALLRVSACLITENPFPVTQPSSVSDADSSSLSASPFLPAAWQTHPRYRVSILSTDAEAKHFACETISEAGGALFPQIREAITTAAEKHLQLSTDRIRLLLNSFEDYHPQNISREQDLAEWLLRSHVGFDNVVIRTVYAEDQRAWIGCVSIKTPVFECHYPEDTSFASNTSAIDHTTAAVAAASPCSVAAAAAAAAAPGTSPSTSLAPAAMVVGASGVVTTTTTTTTTVPRVYEEIELARVLAPSRRVAIKLGLVRAAVLNCFAHLNYLSQKSIEMQSDADALLGLDTEQFDSKYVTTEQGAAFHCLTPSPLSVLRAVLKSENRALKVVVEQQQQQQTSSSDSSSSSPARVNMFGDHSIAQQQQLGVAVSTLDPQEQQGSIIFECVLYAVPLSNVSSKSSSSSTEASSSSSSSSSCEERSQQQQSEATDASSSPVVLARATSRGGHDVTSSDGDTTRGVDVIGDAQAALDAAVQKALHDLMNDRDLRFWKRGWNLQIETLDTITLEAPLHIPEATKLA